MISTTLTCKFRLWILFLLLFSFTFSLPARAESGSTQAVMALIVPANDLNMSLNSAESSQDPNRYEAGTKVSVLQQVGKTKLRVWIEI